MLKPSSWIARTFTFDRPANVFPEILQRLRGIPARAAEIDAANHNHKPIAIILEDLRRHRLQWTAKLDLLTEADLGRTAIHPRLQQAMRVLDWAYFIAEHDDHHLSSTRYALQGQQ